MANRVGRRSFGTVKRLKSGRFQASYIGGDGVRRTGPHTYPTTEDAERWLADRAREVRGGTWKVPDNDPIGERFDTYAWRWLKEHRKADGNEIAPGTRDLYRHHLTKRILPGFGHMYLKHITRDDVMSWYTKMGRGSLTARSNAYGLLRTILNDAVYMGDLDKNPAEIRGAGKPKREKPIYPATVAELKIMVDTVPDRYKLMLELATWLSMRFGELTELRRGDINVSQGIVHVTRAVYRSRVYDDQTGKHIRTDYVVRTPKWESVRDITIPQALMPRVVHHLGQHTGVRKDALLFPPANGESTHMAPASLYKVWYRARKAAGREDLTFHGLRHTGAVFTAQTDPTLAALMERLGHSTITAAMRYQHAAQDSGRKIADGLSKIMDESA